MNGAVSKIRRLRNLKSYAHAGREPPLYYYRDRDGVEIDLIRKPTGFCTRLKSRKPPRPDPDIVRGFKALDHSPLKRGAGAVVCMASDIGAIELPDPDRPCLAI
jgi:hypothetical protein